MKILLYRIFIAIFAITLASCVTSNKGGEVYLSDFLDEESALIDATPAIRAALEYCTQIKASKLVLPGGELRLQPDFAIEKYQFISNNDESLKRIAFNIEDMNNFTIEGANTKLLFSGFISPFNFERCSNITVKDLSIDYTRTFHSEGTVKAVGQGWIDVEFPKDYIYDLSDGCIRFLDDKGTVYPFFSLLEYDAVKREPAFHVDDYWLTKYTIPAKLQPNGDVRLFREDLKATVGNVMIFGTAWRLNPAFTVTDSKDFFMNNVQLYHCGGMGVIAQRSHNIELKNYDVLPTPGSNRMISITADATHFVNCSGYIRILDCVFENQKDDATNIHGWYMAVHKVMSPDKAILQWRHSGQFGIDFLKEGMLLEFVDNNTLDTYAHRTVKSVNRINKNFTEVTFTEQLPDNVKPLHVVAVDEQYPEVLIKGCRFLGNRARGLLIGSRGPVIIEDNYFHIAGASILFEGDGSYWYEQSGVRDVVIRNNVFENCNYGSLGWGLACIAVGTGVVDCNTSRYHKNIRVDGNTFRVFDPRIVHLYSVDGFAFAIDNVIEYTKDYPDTVKERNNFVTNSCDNIIIPFGAGLEHCHLPV